jgi:hypothetical protein
MFYLVAQGWKPRQPWFAVFEMAAGKVVRGLRGNRKKL